MSCSRPQGLLAAQHQHKESLYVAKTRRAASEAELNDQIAASLTTDRQKERAQLVARTASSTAGRVLQRVIRSISMPMSRKIKLFTPKPADSQKPSSVFVEADTLKAQRRVINQQQLPHRRHAKDAQFEAPNATATVCKMLERIIVELNRPGTSNLRLATRVPPAITTKVEVHRES